MVLIQNGKDSILTITERMTRYLLIEKLQHGKDTDGVAQKAIKLLKPCKKKCQVHNN